VHAAVKLICRYKCNQLHGKTHVRDYLNYASVQDVNLIKVSFMCRPAELITPDTFRTAVPQAAPTSLQTHTGEALFICECDHIDQVVDARQVSINDIWRRCAITQRCGRERTQLTGNHRDSDYDTHGMKWNEIELAGPQRTAQLVRCEKLVERGAAAGALRFFGLVGGLCRGTTVSGCETRKHCPAVQRSSLL